MKIPDLFLLVNGSTLRAFRHTGNEDTASDSSPHLTELSLDETEAHPKGNFEEDTDRQGRFETNQGPGNSSNLVSGEQHSLGQEHEKRQAIALALAMQRVWESAEASSWTLVAPAQWKKEIISHLSKQLSSHLQHSIEGDWTKLPLAKIEERLLG